MTTSTEDFTTPLGRMTEAVLDMYRNGYSFNTGHGLCEASVLAACFTPYEFRTHADKAIAQAREIYAAEARNQAPASHEAVIEPGKEE